MYTFWEFRAFTTSHKVNANGWWQLEPYGGWLERSMLAFRKGAARKKPSMIDSMCGETRMH